MNAKKWGTVRCGWVWLLATLGAGAAHAEAVPEAMHHAPTLEMWVERQSERLPLSQVPRLQKGDRVWVLPDPDSLAKGDWALVLGRVSPTGNQVASRDFDVHALHEAASLDITADQQIPVVLLAPQLRNLFGLYTSLNESTRLLNEVLRTDPQRFFDLQKVDHINQAIQAIGQGLNRRLAEHPNSAAPALAQQLAAQFGVRQLDPNCLKNGGVNTECVAHNIVFNQDFSLPSANDLTAMVGQKTALELNNFLVANLRLISQASEYLGTKYRDTYDFAPTFGRRQEGSARIELFSMARFKSGNVKTAYIYVPAWFGGPMPLLQPQTQAQVCYQNGELPVTVSGRLPLANHWHGWQMQLQDPATGATWQPDTAVRFDPTGQRFLFLPLDRAALPPETRELQVQFEGRFGFENVGLPPVRLSLPWQNSEQVRADWSPQSPLVAGERPRWQLDLGPRGACVTGLKATLPSGKEVHSAPASPHQIDLDLSREAPGTLRLHLEQVASPDLLLEWPVLPPRAQVTRVKHADGEPMLVAEGPRLERIARLEWGPWSCAPGEVLEAQKRAFVCADQGLRHSDGPDQVQVVHLDQEPATFAVALDKDPMPPRFGLATDTPYALLTVPSAKAQQWQLQSDDPWLSDDSGLKLLLRAQAPYRLEKGGYSLQLRFVDDPHTQQQPIQAALMSDLAHQELRTLDAVRFGDVSLPSVLNPLEFRVKHQASGRHSAWQSLPRSVLRLPDLQSCTGGAVAGRHLDLIDTLRGPNMADFQAPPLVACPSGLCVLLPEPGAWVDVRLRWLPERVFRVKWPACGGG